MGGQFDGFVEYAKYLPGNEVRLNNREVYQILKRMHCPPSLESFYLSIFPF
jgi:hypothetical protein